MSAISSFDVLIFSSIFASLFNLMNSSDSFFKTGDTDSSTPTAACPVLVTCLTFSRLHPVNNKEQRTKTLQIIISFSHFQIPGNSSKKPIQNKNHPEQSLYILTAVKM